MESYLSRIGDVTIERVAPRRLSQSSGPLQPQMPTITSPPPSGVQSPPFPMFSMPPTFPMQLPPLPMQTDEDLPTQVPVPDATPLIEPQTADRKELSSSENGEMEVDGSNDERQQEEKTDDVSESSNREEEEENEEKSLEKEESSDPAPEAEKHTATEEDGGNSSNTSEEAEMQQDDEGDSETKTEQDGEKSKKRKCANGASEDGDSKKKKKEKKKKEEGEENKSSSDSDESDSQDKDKKKKERKSTNLRRNIREVMDESELDEETKAAQRQEMERLRRVQEQQRIIREVQRQIMQNKQRGRPSINLQSSSSLLRQCTITATGGSSSSAASGGSGVRIPPAVLMKLAAAGGDKKVIEMLTSGKRTARSSSQDSGGVSILRSSRSGEEHDSESDDEAECEEDDDDDVILFPESEDVISISPRIKEPLLRLGPEVSATPILPPEKPKGKELVTISSSSSEDEDCVILSPAGSEDESEPEDPNNCGMHTNDLYNTPDEQGRVLINVGHPKDETDIFLAPQIARQIKPHQIGGLRFLYDNVVESLERYKTSPGFGCILAHSMGLGKTLQVVAFCDVFLRYTPARTVLCIMPINTLQNWLAEFNLWLPEKLTDAQLASGEAFTLRHFPLLILNDSHKSLYARAKVIREWYRNGGVLLMGYELYRQLSLRRDKLRGRRKGRRNQFELPDIPDEGRNKQLWDDVHEALVKPGPDLVICDEGHRIKNSHASISHALKSLTTKRRVVLTGYPLQNNLLEYWCMVDFVRPNYLGTKTEFCNMFERPIQNGQCIDSTPQDIRLMRYRAHVLHSLLEGFVQRRSHSVLQVSLPQKEEYVLLLRMTAFQRALYNKFMNEVVRVKAVPNPLKAFAVCCKIWNHPDVLYYFLKKHEEAEEVDLDIDDPTAPVVVRPILDCPPGSIAESVAAVAAGAGEIPKRAVKGRPRVNQSKKDKVEKPAASVNPTHNPPKPEAAETKPPESTDTTEKEALFPTTANPSDSSQSSQPPQQASGQPTTYPNFPSYQYFDSNSTYPDSQYNASYQEYYNQQYGSQGQYYPEQYPNTPGYYPQQQAQSQPQQNSQNYQPYWQQSQQPQQFDQNYQQNFPQTPQQPGFYGNNFPNDKPAEGFSARSDNFTNHFQQNNYSAYPNQQHPSSGQPNASQNQPSNSTQSAANNSVPQTTNEVQSTTNLSSCQLQNANPTTANPTQSQPINHIQAQPIINTIPTPGNVSQNPTQIGGQQMSPQNAPPVSSLTSQLVSGQHAGQIPTLVGPDVQPLPQQINGPNNVPIPQPIPSSNSLLNPQSLPVSNGLPISQPIPGPTGLSITQSIPGSNVLPVCGPPGQSISGPSGPAVPPIAQPVLNNSLGQHISGPSNQSMSQAIPGSCPSMQMPVQNDLQMSQQLPPVLNGQQAAIPGPQPVSTLNVPQIPQQPPVPSGQIPATLSGTQIQPSQAVPGSSVPHMSSLNGPHTGQLPIQNGPQISPENSQQMVNTQQLSETETAVPLETNMESFSTRVFSDTEVKAEMDKITEEVEGKMAEAAKKEVATLTSPLKDDLAEEIKPKVEGDEDKKLEDEVQVEGVKVMRRIEGKSLLEIGTNAYRAGRDEPSISYDWATELLRCYEPGHIESCAKMEITFCILEQSILLGDRMLVFSQSLFTLNLIEDFLQRCKVPGTQEYWAKNVNYYRLDGSTSPLEREKLINEYNSNPKIHLFLVSTRAGSLGINLVGANRVVVFDASWNPCHDTQAVCRVYRYGQRKPCFVYRLVMDHCLEKKIYDRQINKQGMSDRVVDELNPDAHLSIKDVSNLLYDSEPEECSSDFSGSKDKYIDVVLQRVLERHSYGLSKEPFQHESLLVDRKEKKLSQAERRLAKRNYELEKQAALQPRGYTNYTVGPSGVPNVTATNPNAPGLQIRSIRVDGAKPIASVRPMQAEQGPRGHLHPGPAGRSRWIPAEVWQRQGMSAQEMTLPLDVVIPTNSPDRASIVLKAGQRVMVLKSPKGIYMQLENGKIIAIRTALKMGDPRKPELGKPPISTNTILSNQDKKEEKDVVATSSSSPMKFPQKVSNVFPLKSNSEITITPRSGSAAKTVTNTVLPNPQKPFSSEIPGSSAWRSEHRVQPTTKPALPRPSTAQHFSQPTRPFYHQQNRNSATVAPEMKDSPVFEAASQDFGTSSTPRSSNFQSKPQPQQSQSYQHFQQPRTEDYNISRTTSSSYQPFDNKSSYTSSAMQPSTQQTSDSSMQRPHHHHQLQARPQSSMSQQSLPQRQQQQQQHYSQNSTSLGMSTQVKPREVDPISALQHHMPPLGNSLMHDNKHKASNNPPSTTSPSRSKPVTKSSKPKKSSREPPFDFSTDEAKTQKSFAPKATEKNEFGYQQGTEYYGSQQYGGAGYYPQFPAEKKKEEEKKKETVPRTETSSTATTTSTSYNTSGGGIVASSQQTFGDPYAQGQYPGYSSSYRNSSSTASYPAYSSFNPQYPEANSAMYSAFHRPEPFPTGSDISSFLSHPFIPSSSFPTAASQSTSNPYYPQNVYPPTPGYGRSPYPATSVDPYHAYPTGFNPFLVPSTPSYPTLPATNPPPSSSSDGHSSQ